MMLPPVLLLDLDDTLVSFSAGPRDFWAEAFAAEERASGPVAGFSGALSAAEREAAFLSSIERVALPYWSDPRRAARGRLDLFAARRHVAALAWAELGLPDPARCARIADDFTERKEQAVAPFDGAIDTLRTLRARGIRLGLVTNGSGPFQRRKLQRYALEPFFEAIVVEGEHGVGKPDPSVFHEVLRRMDARPEQAMMVGDNLHADVAGAQGVGIAGVWNDHARAGLPPGSPVRPDRIIHHVRELL